jgi:hypothetical protein
LEIRPRIPSASDIKRIFEWIGKVKKFFEPFKPEFRDMRISYRTQKSEIGLVLYIPNSLKRSINKIEIPAYQNFAVSDMIDESFSRIPSAWQFDNGKWVLKPSMLPASEKYLLKLKGEVPKETLLDIVRIQPAQNRDQTSELDKYWLHSMIRNVAFIEQIYRELEVSDIDVAVNVGVERCFSTTFPEEMKRVLEASKRWIQAGHGRDRNEIQRAWLNLRRVTGASRIQVGDIVKTIYRLTLGELFADYLSVDMPYSLSEIRREERFMGLFPEKMTVEACTDLNLKQPVATGYLTFKKKEYMKKIEEFLSELKK